MRAKTLAGWAFGALAVVAVVVVGWRVLPSPPRASGEPGNNSGPLSACHGVEGEEFSIADGANGQPTPEQAIAAIQGLPPGTPTEHYATLPGTPMGTALTGRETVSYVHQSKGKADALAQVVPVGSGWAVASIAHCTS